MSGGDDLESDDEYLNQSWHKNEPVEVAVDDSLERDEKNSKRRSGADSNELNDEDVTSSRTKKRKKNPRGLLLEAGRDVADSGPEVQSTFLWTAFVHALKLKGEEIESPQFRPNNFAQPVKCNEGYKIDNSMAKYLKSGVVSSFKRLKKWKTEKSPMVIIMCISALRAVEILKDISSLNIRAAKLFAKHMNLSDQVSMLKSNSYPIAVGTPNRLLKLFDTTEEGGSDGGALSLDHTELIIIDCFEDKKKFTVCTMNDTAPDLMKFILDAVVPQMKKRDNIKFGMF